MNKKIGFIILFLIMLSFLGLGNPTNNNRKIIDFKEVEINGNVFSVVSFDSNYFDIKVKTAESLTGKKLAPLYEAFEIERDEGVVAAISGSYFDIEYREGEKIIEPVGLVIEEGKELSSLFDKREVLRLNVDLYKGYPDQALYVEDGNIKIDRVYNFKEIYGSEINISSALQPGDLIDNGKSIIGDCEEQPIHCDNRASRSVFCIDEKGKVKLIVVKNIDLIELAEILTKNPFNCYDAVNLDGGGSTSLEFDFNGVKKSIQYKRFFELKRRPIFSYIIIYGNNRKGNINKIIYLNKIRKNSSFFNKLRSFLKFRL